MQGLGRGLPLAPWRSLVTCAVLVQQMDARSPLRDGHHVVIPALTRPNNSASSLGVPRCPSPRYSASRLEALVCGEARSDEPCRSGGQNWILRFPICDSSVALFRRLHWVIVGPQRSCQS